MIQAGGEGYTVIDEPAVSGRRCRVSDSFARFLGACVAILAAIISWVILAEKLQKVNKEYHKPFFVTYWVHGFGYSLLYVIWQLWLVVPGNLSCNRVGEGVWRGNSRQLLILSGVLAAVFFTSAYAWYYSLARTNIPANTSIYQSACVWVFLLSIVLLRERVTVLKITAVVVSVVGVSLVAVFSSQNCSPDSTAHGNATINATGLVNLSATETESSHLLGHIHRADPCKEQSTPLGYVALFYSVISYAVFEVSYKKWGSKEEDKAAVFNSVRVLGYMGVHTLAWFWPFFFILHYSGIEPFEWPPFDIFILLLWNAFLDILFNAGLLICIALSSALFASVGTVLVIPVAILVDWMLQGFLLAPLAAFGVVLIIIGFTEFMVSEVIAMRTKSRTKGEVRKLKDHHLRSSVCSHNNENNITEEDDKETTSLLKSQHRRRRINIILKYLF